MPSVVITTYAGDLMKAAFANPLAALPVQRDAGQPANGYVGGVGVFKQVTCLLAGCWLKQKFMGVYDQYHPRLVHLGITGFLMVITTG